MEDEIIRKRLEEEKIKGNFGKLILGIIGFFIITFGIIFVYYGLTYTPEKQMEDKMLNEKELDKTIQDTKQAIQFQKENPDVDMFCLEKTRQNYKEMGIEDLYEQGYQASCVEQTNLNSELDLETFCTLETMEFYQSLGMGNIYHEIAIKEC